MDLLLRVNYLSLEWADQLVSSGGAVLEPLLQSDDAFARVSQTQILLLHHSFALQKRERVINTSSETDKGET